MLLPLLALALWHTDPCKGQGTRVLVETRPHRLYLCHADKTEGWFHVALGSEGVSVADDGTSRTPLGTYALMPPRQTASYGTELAFVGALSIHGPARDAQPLGELSAWVDWTDGSVALGFDRQVTAIVDWLRRRSAHQITLR